MSRTTVEPTLDPFHPVRVPCDRFIAETEATDHIRRCDDCAYILTEEDSPRGYADEVDVIDIRQLFAGFGDPNLL